MRDRNRQQYFLTEEMLSSTTKELIFIFLSCSVYISLQFLHPSITIFVVNSVSVPLAFLYSQAAAGLESPSFQPFVRRGWLDASKLICSSGVPGGELF